MGNVRLFVDDLKKSQNPAMLRLKEDQWLIKNPLETKSQQWESNFIYDLKRGTIYLNGHAIDIPAFNKKNDKEKQDYVINFIVEHLFKGNKEDFLYNFGRIEKPWNQIAFSVAQTAVGENVANSNRISVVSGITNVTYDNGQFAIDVVLFNIMLKDNETTSELPGLISSNFSLTPDQKFKLEWIKCSNALLEKLITEEQTTISIDEINFVKDQPFNFFIKMPIPRNKNISNLAQQAFRVSEGIQLVKQIQFESLSHQSSEAIDVSAREISVNLILNNIAAVVNQMVFDPFNKTLDIVYADLLANLNLDKELEKIINPIATEFVSYLQEKRESLNEEFHALSSLVSTSSDSVEKAQAVFLLSLATEFSKNKNDIPMEPEELIEKIQSATKKIQSATKRTAWHNFLCSKEKTNPVETKHSTVNEEGKEALSSRFSSKK